MSLLNALILHRNDRGPVSDEERDAPPLTPEDCLAWFRIVLLCLALLLAYLLGTLAGSVLLHTWDADIRHGLSWLWEAHQRLYWAWAQLHG